MFPMLENYELRHRIASLERLMRKRGCNTTILGSRLQPETFFSKVIHPHFIEPLLRHSMTVDDHPDTGNNNAQQMTAAE